MQQFMVLRTLGILLMIFSISMLPPVFIAYFYEDGAGTAFLLSGVLTLLTGGLLWWPVRHVSQELKIRDGFIIVVLFWSVLSLFGALPFMFADEIQLSPADAIFESFSGLTTTGATVMVGLDALPKAILYYRQQLQWFGGMGIIVLAVAIMPMLGIGGMQLYRAETPGPVKDSKLTPRIAGTAKALWMIYLGLTVLCTLSYWVAGMGLFDAINHAFSTVAIGGFSTHDASIGFFESHTIEMVCAFFMLISGVNFSLHFIAFQRFDFKPYFADLEFRAYLFIHGLIAFICCLVLVLTEYYPLGDAFYHGVFHAISIGTTSGFATQDFTNWPHILPVLLILASFAGGSAGSTAGGMKVIRILLLFKQGMREIKRLVHPNAVLAIKLGVKALDNRIIDAVWGFFATYVVVFVVMLLILLADGLDQVTAFSAVAACLNNLGPGLGDVSANYSSVSDLTKWTLCAAMLLGRLEIFTLFVLLTPTFWRK